ncbi:MAG: hypothetical protein N3A38_16100, partial [Planctomycetota bacterium]|nr:hypothetical protein [Planctomycetota bacterium]
MPQTQDLRNRIVALCTAWTLVSPYTSFLVLESESEYERYGIDRTARRPLRVSWRKASPPREKPAVVVPAAGTGSRPAVLPDPWSGRFRAVAPAPAAAAPKPRPELPALRDPAPLRMPAGKNVPIWPDGRRTFACLLYTS